MARNDANPWPGNAEPGGTGFDPSSTPGPLGLAFWVSGSACRILCCGCGVSGLGFGVWVLAFGVWRLTFRVQCSGFRFRVRGWGFRVQGTSFIAQELGLKVSGLGFTPSCVVCRRGIGGWGRVVWRPWSMCLRIRGKCQHLFTITFANREIGSVGSCQASIQNVQRF